MNVKMLVGLGFILLASSASASVVTPGGDFDAADGDVANVAHTVFGTNYSGTTTATVIGGLKRQPATAADGSQTVTIQFGRPVGTRINGVIWSYDLNFMFMRGFNSTVNDTGSGVTKSVTFPASELTNVSYLVGVVYLQPNVTVFGATVN